MTEMTDGYIEFDAKVDAYLRHEMTDSEERAFLAEIAADSELMDRARMIAFMIKAMSTAGLELDQQMVDAIKDMRENQFRQVAGLKPRVKPVSYWARFTRYAAAACVAGALCWAGYHYYGVRQTVNLGNSYDYYAYAMDISEAGSSRGASASEVTDTLVTLFESVREGQSLGNAIATLQEFYDSALNEDSDFHTYDNDIAWNLAIAYLKDGDRDKARYLLEKMVMRNKEYPDIARPARALLDKIDKL